MDDAQRNLDGEIVVTFPSYDLDGPAAGRALTDAGLTVRQEPRTGARTAEELASILQGAIGVVASTDPFTADVFAANPQLQVIGRTGIGFDAVDLDAATEAGVVVATTPGAGEETVADHALMLLSALIHKLGVNDAAIRAGLWDRGGEFTPNDVSGSTIGVVGAGTIGLAVIRRLRAFGSTILVADPFLTEAPDGTELVELDDLLRRCDAVTLHIPSTPQTYHLIGREQLESMKPTAVLVNTSRGGLVDEEALAEALREETLAGAGIDVFETEPPFDTPLLDAPNTILTPHTAGLSRASIRRITEMATLAVLQVLRGETPASVVNPAVLEQRRSSGT